MKIYQLMSSLSQSLLHVFCRCCWRWWELLQELYSTKRSSPWDDAGFLGKFIFWWIWFWWRRLEVGRCLTLFLAKSAEANAPAPRDATAIHYVAVGRNTQRSNWEAEILALIYGRLTSLFGEGKKVSLCTLCSPTGVSRVACGKTCPFTQRRRLRRYFRSECCIGVRPIATLRAKFSLASICWFQTPGCTGHK